MKLSESKSKYYDLKTKEFLTKKEEVYLFTDHSSSIGSYNEQLFRSFLKAHLPKSLKVGTGFIRSAASSSKQCDILIYKDHQFAPLLQMDDFVIVEPEAVVCVIEIKSSINKKEDVQSSISNLISAKRQQPKTIQTYLFAYKATDNFSLFQFESALRDYDDEKVQLDEYPTAMLILDNEWMFRLHKAGFRQFIPTNMELDIPLQYFFGIISSCCDAHLSKKPDINKYFDMNTVRRMESTREIVIGTPFRDGEKQFLKAVSLQSEKKHDEAIEKYNEALRGDYDKDTILFSRACCYADMGKRSEAKQDFESALEEADKKNKETEPIKFQYGRFLVLQFYNDKNLLEKGIDFLKSLLKGLPHEEDMMLFIAYALIKLGKNLESIEWSKKSLALNGNCKVMNQINLALAYKKLKNDAELIKLNIESLANQTQSDWEKALIYALLEKKDFTLKFFKKSLETNRNQSVKDFPETLEFEYFWNDSDFIKLLN